MKPGYVNLLNPSRVFLILALAGGLSSIFLTPPFQVPDEFNHFFRAWQISEGTFKSVKTNDKRIGGTVPTACIEFASHFRRMPGKLHEKTSFHEIVSLHSIRMDETKREFIDFPNTAAYTPAGYIVQAISLRLARVFSSSVMVIFYSGRLITFLFWVLLVWFAIRLIPSFKWLMCALALLPMSIFVNASLSGDVLINGVAFLSIALLFSLKSEKHQIKSYIWLTVCFIILSATKFIYLPVALLFFAIRHESFGSLKRYQLVLLTMMLPVLLSIYFSLQYTQHHFMTYAQYHTVYRETLDVVDGANPQEQMHYILTHGGYMLKVCMNSLVRAFDMYIQGYIGRLGWLEVGLPWLYIVFAWLSIAVVALADTDDAHLLSGIKVRLLCFAGFVLSLFLLILSQHLTWGPVGCDVVMNMQGRYLIPMLPLLFISLNQSTGKRYRFVMDTVLFSSVIGLVVMILALYNRYYG